MTDKSSRPGGHRLSRREVIAGLAMLSARHRGRAQARHPDSTIWGITSSIRSCRSRSAGGSSSTSSGLVYRLRTSLQLAVYSQLLTSVYSDGNTPISHADRLQRRSNRFPPGPPARILLHGRGLYFVGLRKHKIQLDPAKQIATNSLTAIRENQRKLVYWTRIGHHVPLSWAQQKLTVAEENLEKAHPGRCAGPYFDHGLDERGDAHASTNSRGQ